MKFVILAKDGVGITNYSCRRCVYHYEWSIQYTASRHIRDLLKHGLNRLDYMDLTDRYQVYGFSKKEDAERAKEAYEQLILSGNVHMVCKDHFEIKILEVNADSTRVEWCDIYKALK